MDFVIISGGSGSTELQKGFYNTIGKIPTNLINLYDDGKSTGIVRNIYDILGPSDLRKCHTEKARIEGVSPDLVSLLEYRYTGSVNDLIEIWDSLLEKAFKTVIHGDVNDHVMSKIRDCFLPFINNYKNWYGHDMNDFCLGNIIYGYLMGAFGHNLAEYEMRKLLGIKSQVIFNSHKNITLQAVTKENKPVRDEASIVDHNNEKDPIKDIIMDKTSICARTSGMLHKCDAVIISCGTPWSSIIPTLRTAGVLGTIKDKPVYVVLNASDDGDTKGYDAHKYADMYDRELSGIAKVYYFYPTEEVLRDNGKHNGDVLAAYLIKKFLNSKTRKVKAIVSDADGTISPKGFYSLGDISERFRKYIVSGNDIDKGLLGHDDTLLDWPFVDSIYYDCGQYRLHDSNMNIGTKNWDSDMLEKLQSFSRHYFVRSLIGNMIRLTDISNRDEIIGDIRHIINTYGLVAVYRGKTTIEIHEPHLDKINRFKDDHPWNRDEVLYIGNEPKGNDKKAMSLYNHIVVDSEKEGDFIMKTLKEMTN